MVRIKGKKERRKETEAGKGMRRREKRMVSKGGRKADMKKRVTDRRIII